MSLCRLCIQEVNPAYEIVLYFFVFSGEIVMVGQMKYLLKLKPTEVGGACI